MTVRRSLPLCLALAAAVFLAATVAAETFKPSKYGTSFVDADDDGVFDAGTDVRLSSILAPDEARFDTDTPRPGYIPPPPPVGLVLEGKVTLVAWDQFYASGTLRVRGDVVSLGEYPESFDALGMDAETIDIAPRSKITHKSEGGLYITGVTVRIGERTRITSLSDVWIGANGPMVLGDNVQVRSTGNKEDFEPSVWVLAFDLQAGDGFYMRANDHADCLIEHNGETSIELVMNRARIRCGYIELASYDHPEGNRIRLTNSYLDSRTPDGRIRFYLGEGPDGFLPDPLVLVNTSLRARGYVDANVPLP